MNDIKGIKFNFISDLQPLIIAGPCSAESREQMLESAKGVAACGVKVFRAGIWKPRTKPGCFEGVGDIGLDWLNQIKKETGMAVSCEVACPEHVQAALNAGIDILWIGARTAANPFAVQEIAEALSDSEVPVFVKNPVNPDLELWIGAIERLQNSGVKNIGAIHRGFSSFENKIYRNDPIWQIPIELRRRFPNMTILCDPSHLGGRREYIADISRKAYDLDFDGLMLEVHCNPECALSDAPQQITPEELSILLNTLVKRGNRSISETLSTLRQEIDDIDTNIIKLLSRRMSLSKEIGEHKKASNMPVLQNNRYQEILKDRCALGESLGLSSGFVENIMKDIHEESVKSQL